MVSGRSDGSGEHGGAGEDEGHDGVSAVGDDAGDQESEFVGVAQVVEPTLDCGLREAYTARSLSGER